ncbi:MAG: transporter [Candidatus Binatia bacterium]|nr:transporter [Candidatus Binatia bacterium]
MTVGQFLRIGVVCVVTQVCLCTAFVLPSNARSLRDAFVQGFVFPTAPGGVGTTTRDGESLVGFFAPDGSLASPEALARAAQGVAPVIAAAVAHAVTQQFPLASVAPAFTYRYNPTLSIYERSTGVPGPLYSERALTLGKGQFNFSIGYSYIDFDEFNGTDLGNIVSPALINEIFLPDLEFNGIPLFPFVLSQLRTRIDLQAHVIVPAFRYGITDHWDVSLAIPIVNTSVRVRNEVRRVAGLSNGRLGVVGDDLLFFGVSPDLSRVTQVIPITPDTITQIPFSLSQRPPALLARAAASATGVGDISLRTKYHFWRTENGGATVGLNLLLPSGDVDDFHGTDETHVIPFLIVSQVMGDRFEPHVNIGFDFNADDVDRTAFVYAVGATFMVWDRLGLSVDFIGRSEFGRFPAPIPSSAFVFGQRLNRPAASCTTEQPCNVVRELIPFPLFPKRVRRNDLEDFSFGVRYALGTSGSIFFGGIIPLNPDGLRADFIPSGGVEYSF